MLDAGCGTGYGSRLLAGGGARQVVGVDQARAVLDTAAPAMPDSVRLQVGDLRKLEFEDDKFELVVCFEVIEFFDDPLTVLDELVRVLAPAGMLLVCAPNCGVYQPGDPYHLHEFAPAELERVLAARLRHVQLLRQHDYVASGVRSGTGGDLAVHELAEDTPGEVIYTLAMASDAELPVMRDLAAIGGAAALGDWLSAIDTQAAAIAERESKIDELGARLQERDRLAELLGEAELRSAQLPQLRQRVADLELELADARAAAAAARQEADQLDRMLMYGRRMLRYVRPLIKPLRRLRRKLRG